MDSEYLATELDPGSIGRHQRPEEVSLDTIRTMKIYKRLYGFPIWLLLIAVGAPCQDQKLVSATSNSNIADTEISMMRKDLRDQKKQIIAANLPLNGDEAAKFWPVYDAYTQETIKVNDHRYGLVKDYAVN